MTGVLLAGPLARPAMRAALGLSGGRDVTLPGRLAGGGRAGIAPDGWPAYDPAAPGRVAGWVGPGSAALARYAEIMGLAPVATPSNAGGGVPGTMLGVAPHPGPAPADDAPWPEALAAAIARDLAMLPSDGDPAAVRARLPMIALRADSRLRAEAERGTPAPPGPMPDTGDRVTILGRDQPYARYFAVDELTLRHRLYRGGWSEPLLRAVFVSGDAVVVLPWDPVRDRVLVVDQFRAGPAARGDARPWLTEPIAGRIDPGETPETTALREAGEEAGLTLTRLIPAPGHYPTPGIVAEYLYGFIGLCDLPDGVAGVSGLQAEGEDIRGTVLDRAALTAMALDGRIVNGPLIVLALWLDRMAGTLRPGPGAGGAGAPPDTAPGAPPGA